MKRRRVKITGIGPVTPAGVGKNNFWEGILEPISRVRPFTDLGEGFGPFVAAYLDQFDIADFIDRRKLPKGIARHSTFAVAGAVLALEDAGLHLDDLCTRHAVVITGSAVMDFESIIESMDGVIRKGARAAQPRSLYTVSTGSVAAAVAAALGLSVHATSVSNQCVSGLDAIAYAARLIAGGEADIAVCGGTDAPLNRFPLVELRAAGLTPESYDTPTRVARPFDLWRTTGVIAEGCCMFVLEAENSPRPGYSWVAGYGSATDQDDSVGSLVKAINAAVAQARMHSSEIDAISAWAPGHRVVDRVEASALQHIFGTDLPGIAVNSIKGAIGSPLAAAPAIQIATVALGQQQALMPPTVNWEYPDPDCPVNLTRTPRSVFHPKALISAQGLGSVSSAMVLQSC